MPIQPPPPPLLGPSPASPLLFPLLHQLYSPPLRSLPSHSFLLPQNVLHDVPDYEERRRLLETLKNRLEALLSPKLTAAFNNHLTGEW